MLFSAYYTLTFTGILAEDLTTKNVDIGNSFRLLVRSTKIRNQSLIESTVDRTSHQR